MRRDVLLGSWVLLLVASLGAGCTTHPVTTSAQVGSTIVIPFSVESVPGYVPLPVFGFGGSEFDDPQRGRMVVHLGDETGPTLDTRLSFLVTAPVESELGVRSSFGATLLVMVDIPAGTPLGIHDVVLVHERDVAGGVEETVLLSPQTIRVLPDQVLAGSDLITGAPTPSQVFFAGAWWNLIGTNNGQPFNNYEQLVPEPSFGVRVSTDTGVPPPDTAPRFIAYAKVEVDYPEDVIDVKRVVSQEPIHSVVSWQDDGDRITAWSLTKTKHDPFVAGQITALGDLRVVFGLDDEAVPLDLGDVDVTLLEVRDQFGQASIEGDWGVVASTAPIR